MGFKVEPIMSDGREERQEQQERLKEEKKREREDPFDRRYEDDGAPERGASAPAISVAGAGPPARIADSPEERSRDPQSLLSASGRLRDRPGST